MKKNISEEKLQEYIEQINQGRIERQEVNDLEDQILFEQWNKLRIAVNDYEISKIKKLSDSMEEVLKRLDKMENNHLKNYKEGEHIPSLDFINKLVSKIDKLETKVNGIEKLT